MLVLCHAACAQQYKPGVAISHVRLLQDPSEDETPLAFRLSQLVTEPAIQASGAQHGTGNDASAPAGCVNGKSGCTPPPPRPPHSTPFAPLTPSTRPAPPPPPQPRPPTPPKTPAVPAYPPAFIPCTYNRKELFDCANWCDPAHAAQHCYRECRCAACDWCPESILTVSSNRPRPPPPSPSPPPPPLPPPAITPGWGCVKGRKEIMHPVTHIGCTSHVITTEKQCNMYYVRTSTGEPALLPSSTQQQHTCGCWRLTCYCPDADVDIHSVCVD